MSTGRDVGDPPFASGDPRVAGGTPPPTIEAFEAFYRDHEAAILRTALAIVHDPMLAEEIACDTFLRAYRCWARLDRERSPRPWLQKVAVNLAISRLRRRRIPVEALEGIRSAELSRADDPTAGRDVAARVELLETALVLRQVLGGLSPDLRTVVVLRYVEGYSVAEIADLVGRPLGTVKHRLRTALRLIRDGLADDGTALPGREAGLAAPRLPRTGADAPAAPAALTPIGWIPADPGGGPES